MTKMILKTFFIYGLLLFFLILGWMGCSGSIDEDQVRVEATAQILKLHNQQRTNHFEKQVESFIDLLGEDHISVNRGAIQQQSRQAHLDRVTNYFNSVEFEKWDDLQPPIIRFSDDYSMAYTVVDKEVVVRFQDENGVTQRERTKYAWVAIYKKHGNQWLIDCVASTNEPSEIL